MKRPALSATSELEKVRCELYDLMAVVWDKTAAEVRAAAEAASSEATILDIGLTSAMGISLKGAVLRQMEAELTTFQLLKQPLLLEVGAAATLTRQAAVQRVLERAPRLLVHLDHTHKLDLAQVGKRRGGVWPLERLGLKVV